MTVATRFATFNPDVESGEPSGVTKPLESKSVWTKKLRKSALPFQIASTLVELVIPTLNLLVPETDSASGVAAPSLE